MPYILVAAAIGMGCVLGLLKYSTKAAVLFAMYTVVIMGYLAFALYSLKLI